MQPTHGSMQGGTILSLQGSGLTSPVFGLSSLAAVLAPAIGALTNTSQAAAGLSQLGGLSEQLARLGPAAQELVSDIGQQADISIHVQGMPCRLQHVNRTMATCRTTPVQVLGPSCRNPPPAPVLSVQLRSDSCLVSSMLVCLPEGPGRRCTCMSCSLFKQRDHLGASRSHGRQQASLLLCPSDA